MDGGGSRLQGPVEHHTVYLLPPFSDSVDTQNTLVESVKVRRLVISGNQNFPNRYIYRVTESHPDRNGLNKTAYVRKNACLVNTHPQGRLAQPSITTPRGTLQLELMEVTNGRWTERLFRRRTLCSAFSLVDG